MALELVELLLRDRLAQGQVASLRHRMVPTRIVRAVQVTDGLLPERLDQCASPVLFTSSFHALQADSMLLGSASRILVAVLAEHLQLVVNKLCRSDLDWVLRLKLIGGWIVREPKRGLSMGSSWRLVQNLLLLLGQHDDLLLALRLR